MSEFIINQENIKKVQTQGFLESIDHMQIKEQWVRISILNHNDEIVKFSDETPAVLEGCATAGTINVNSSSAIRRSGSLTLVTYDGAEPYFDERFLINKVSDIDNLISINKRVKIEIKIANRGINFNYDGENIVPDFFIFSLGIFVVKNANVAYSMSGLQISVTLGDKMCLLNGECGGTIQTAVTYSPVSYIDENDKVQEEKVKICDLIYTFIEQIAGLTTGIEISEKLEQKIANLIRWNKEYPIYLYRKSSESEEYALTTFQSQGTETFQYNDSLGYQIIDYVYPGELSSNAGDTVVTMLDKLKNILGNWEYFFDVDGVFHFQEIENFINEGSVLDDWTAAIAENYLTLDSTDKVVYEFSDGMLISAYNNAPQYSKVKNDISVWGQKVNSKLAIKYHLIIDTKPTLSEKSYNVNWYIDQLGVIRAKSVTEAEDSSGIKPQDWRQELYFKAVIEEAAYQAHRKNSSVEYTEEIPYMLRQEIIEEFPKIYNILFNGGDGTGFYYKPSEVSWFLDYLDVNEFSEESQDIPVAQFSVEKIGRRTTNITDNEVNCVLPPDGRKILFIKTVAEWEEWEKLGEDNPYEGYVLIDNWADSLSIGTVYNSAYDLIRSAIHEYTSYQNSISLTTMPIYHLEPNTRVAVEDKTSDIKGHYIIQSISIPLALTGMMSITATQALERI